jgi:hypothetical protein
VSTPRTGSHCKLRPNTEGNHFAALNIALKCISLAEKFNASLLRALHGALPSLAAYPPSNQLQVYMGLLHGALPSLAANPP